MDNRKLFSGKADDYCRFRPSYPEAAVKWLRGKSSGEQVVDVGAGTGIFTQVLRHCFKKITAVEPNGDMREKFCEQLPDIPCLDMIGEATGLTDNTFDLITVAQAFHWLDENKFKEEALRILRPGGKVAVIWNTCCPNDFSAARDSICQKYCPRFRAGHAGKRSADEGNDFLRYHYFREVEFAAFDNHFEMDRGIFEGNMRSRSYFLSPDHTEYADLMAELRSLFERYAENGVVTEPLETRIFLGSF